MAAFKHPMNFEELHRPPCFGESSYTEEEQTWCKGPIEYFVSTLDVARSPLRGIPESAVPWRAGQRCAAAAAGRSGPGPAPAPAAPAPAPASVTKWAVPEPVAVAARVWKSHGRAGGSGENKDGADGGIKTQIGQ